MRHKDGNPANNAASNLAWGTAAENASDRLRHGNYARGASHHNAKLTESQVHSMIERRKSGEKVRDLALSFGVSASSVEAIIYRKLWKHVVEFKRVQP